MTGPAVPKEKPSKIGTTIILEAKPSRTLQWLRVRVHAGKAKHIEWRSPTVRHVVPLSDP
jgi:hypothetical protein